MAIMLLPTFSTPRRRRWLLLAAAASFSTYGAYKIYHLPAVTNHRRKLSRILAALSSAAELASLLSSDLTSFLSSDSDELPSSIVQMSKIARSDEFSSSLSTISQALTTGIARAVRSPRPSADTSPGFSDRLMEKLFSAAGSGFASAVAGSFAKGVVMGFRTGEPGGGGSDSPEVPWWVQLACRDESRELIGNCVQLFVSTAVMVYLDKTMDINTYDEFFSGLTNPTHEAKMKEVLVSVCNGAVETLVKTSHQVITSSASNSREGKTRSIQEKESGGVDHKVKEGGVWRDQLTSTLAVPSNRRFVLDVTGRITFETVRSFLDFALWKMHNATKRGASTVRYELAERGLEVVRYFSVNSIVILTICLSLCLHIFFMRMLVLVPA